MTALAANAVRPSRGELRYESFPVAASTTIYAGGLVMINSAGYAVPAAAAASNKGVVGVSTEKVANTGSAGAKWVRVASGLFLVAAGSITQAMINSPLYAQDDNTVDETQGSNEPLAGVLTEFVSTTSCWARIGPAQMTAALAS